MTKKVEFHLNDLHEDHPRRKQREMSKNDFIRYFGSGTLIKGQRLNFDIQDIYLKERTHFEFGYGFEIIQKSRVIYSDIKLESHHALTELCWHAERMMEMKPFESDQFICKQFEISYSDETVKRGAGILVSETSASWIPNGYMIFSVVAIHEHGQYRPAINPF